MIKLMLLSIALLSTSCMAEDNYKTISLNKDNTLVLRSVVDYDSIKRVQQSAFTLSDGLGRRDNIYLVLDTPGGSVAAGLELIESLKALPQKITTLTSFSASMGFVIVQSLGERLILPTGTLMSHRAYVRIDGQIPGEFFTRTLYWTNKLNEINEMISNRVKMPIQQYTDLIHNEFWVDGEKAVDFNMADKVVRAKCDKSLLGKHVETINTLFGPVYVTWSNCPLITTPLAINFGNIETSGASALNVQIIKDLIFKITTDKKGFIREKSYYDKYERYIKWKN